MGFMLAIALFQKAISKIKEWLNGEDTRHGYADILADLAQATCGKEGFDLKRLGTENGIQVAPPEVLIVLKRANDLAKAEKLETLPQTLEVLLDARLKEIGEKIPLAFRAVVSEEEAANMAEIAERERRLSLMKDKPGSLIKPAFKGQEEQPSQEETGRPT